jgi:hypothetical protein
MNLEDTSTVRAPDTGNFKMLFVIALIPLLVHLINNALGAYGYFRDELYYIACSDHLAWGYVDQPPLSLLLLTVSRSIFGDSLVALRLFPALSGSATVILAGLMTREMGGGRFSQALAAVSVSIAGVYLSAFNYYSMNCFDVLFWAIIFYIIIKIINTGDPKLWLWFGVTAGLGLQNKLSIVFLCFGLFVGLLLTEHRRYFLSRWLWLGGLIAVAIFLPHIIWQIQHGWPTIEFMRNVTTYKNLPISPTEFFAGQIGNLHPFNVLVWIPGLVYLLFFKEGKPYRLFGIIYVAIFTVFVMQNSKPYYQSPAYTILFAAGAVYIGNCITKRGWNWFKPVLLSLLITGGILTSPFAIPVLPVETFISFQKAMGEEPRSGERDTPGKLPQMYADMFGWDEMTETIARVYNSLPPDEQAVCGIYGSNYGETGAIDFFGRELGLPKAISGHNSYWFWGPQEYTGEVLIIIGGDPEDHHHYFESCEQAAVHTNEYARSFETDLTIWVCRDIKKPLEEIWSEVKFFI